MSNPNPKFSIGCPYCKGSLYVLADFCHYCKSPLPEVIISELIKIQTQKKMGGVMSNQDPSEKSKPGGKDTGQLTKDDSVAPIYFADSPLNSSDQGKLLIFLLLMAPSVVLLVGVIPTIFLAFGIYMMKKNQDFSSIDTAVKYFRGYVWLSLIVGLAVSFYWWDDWMVCKSEWATIRDQARFCDRRFQYFLNSLLAPAIPIIYLFAVNNLFYSPLKRHSGWVAVNGIFSTKPKSATKPSIKSEVDIIKGEKLKQYSVADELIKWAKLKEEGHISEDEFNDARAKLLKRN
jgi:hypothetical protein